MRVFTAFLAASVAVTDSEDFPHEYRLFWKSSPSGQWTFVNPAYRYFELSSFVSLDTGRKTATKRFCEVVYGTTDPRLCYERMEPFYGRPVNTTQRQ